MKIHFDGGLRKNLMAIVNAGTDEVIIEKRKYDNEHYEWDALEMALIYVLERPHKDEVVLFGDNNQVIRWINEGRPNGSIIKQKCAEKLKRLEDNGDSIIAQWLPREQNLAGRALEYWTRRSSKPTTFRATWNNCKKCSFTSLNEKEKSEHFYNEHVTNG